MATYMKALEQKNQNVKGQKALQGREDILGGFFSQTGMNVTLTSPSLARAKPVRMHKGKILCSKEAGFAFTGAASKIKDLRVFPSPPCPRPPAGLWLVFVSFLVRGCGKQCSQPAEILS